MPRMTKQEQQAFLEQRGVLCRIATLNEDGSPYVTPAWFIHQDGRVYITPRARSRWLANIQRDPRVSITIDEDPTPYRKIRIDGRAAIDFEPGKDDDWRDLYRQIARRYTGDEAAEAYIQNTIDQPRALLSIGLDDATVTSWRMPIAGEPQAGIWHDRYYFEGTQFKGKQ